MFQRIGAGGEAGLGQSRGHDAGVRGFARVKWLGHRAEIRHQAGALRCAEGDRLRCLVGIETTQRCAGRGSADRTVEASRVPAFLMQQAGIAAEQFCPGLVAGNVGDDHVGAGRA